MKENKCQFYLFNPDKYKVRPIIKKPDPPKQTLEEFTVEIQRVANSGRWKNDLRNTFHNNMEKPQKQWPKPTELEQKVKLGIKTKRFLAQLEQAGVLDDVLHQEWTAETIPLIVAKVKEARKTGAKLDPEVEGAFQKNETKVAYLLALRKLRRQKLAKE